MKLKMNTIQHLLKCLPTGAAIVQNFRVVEINGKFSKRLNQIKTELIGKKLYELVHGQQQKKLKEIIKNRREGKYVFKFTSKNCDYLLI